MKFIKTLYKKLFILTLSFFIQDNVFASQQNINNSKLVENLLNSYIDRLSTEVSQYAAIPQNLQNTVKSMITVLFQSFAFPEQGNKRSYKKFEQLMNKLLNSLDERVQMEIRYSIAQSSHIFLELYRLIVNDLGDSISRDFIDQYSFKQYKLNPLPNSFTYLNPYISIEPKHDFSEKMNAKFNETLYITSLSSSSSNGKLRKRKLNSVDNSSDNSNFYPSKKQRCETYNFNDVIKVWLDNINKADNDINFKEKIIIQLQQAFGVNAIEKINDELKGHISNNNLDKIYEDCKKLGALKFNNLINATEADHVRRCRMSKNDQFRKMLQVAEQYLDREIKEQGDTLFKTNDYIGNLFLFTPILNVVPINSFSYGNGQCSNSMEKLILYNKGPKKIAYFKFGEDMLSLYEVKYNVDWIKFKTNNIIYLKELESNNIYQINIKDLNNLSQEKNYKLISKNDIDQRQIILTKNDSVYLETIPFSWEKIKRIEDNEEQIKYLNLDEFGKRIDLNIDSTGKDIKSPGENEFLGRIYSHYGKYAISCFKYTILLHDIDSEKSKKLPAIFLTCSHYYFDEDETRLYGYNKSNGLVCIYDIKNSNLINNFNLPIDAESMKIFGNNCFVINSGGVYLFDVNDLIKNSTTPKYAVKGKFDQATILQAKQKEIFIIGGNNIKTMLFDSFHLKTIFLAEGRHFIIGNNVYRYFNNTFTKYESSFFKTSAGIGKLFGLDSRNEHTQKLWNDELASALFLYKVITSKNIKELEELSIHDKEKNTKLDPGFAQLNDIAQDRVTTFLEKTISEYYLSRYLIGDLVSLVTQYVHSKNYF